MLQLEVKMSHVGLSEAARKLELWSMPFLQLAYVSWQGESSQIRKTAPPGPISAPQNGSTMHFAATQGEPGKAEHKVGITWRTYPRSDTRISQEELLLQSFHDWTSYTHTQGLQAWKQS